MSKGEPTKRRNGADDLVFERVVPPPLADHPYVFWSFGRWSACCFREFP